MKCKASRCILLSMVLTAGAMPAFAAEQVVTGKITKLDGPGGGSMMIGVGRPVYLTFRGKNSASFESFPQLIFVRLTADTKVRIPKPPEQGKSRQKRAKQDPEDKDRRLPGRPGSTHNLKEDQIVQVKLKRLKNSFEAQVVLILGQGPPAVTTEAK